MHLKSSRQDGRKNTHRFILWQGSVIG
jgi:hypothetical protein